MALVGTVYFNFRSADSFRLLQLLVSAEQEGGDVEVTWQGRPDGDAEGEGELGEWDRALAAHALVRDPVRQERFRRAMFVSLHVSGDSPADELTYRAAAKVAGVDADILLEAVDRIGRTEVEAARRRAIDAGVVAVPTIVGDGPALHVVTTPAVGTGSATARVETIAAVLDDDGLWRLSKP